MEMQVQDEDYKEASESSFELLVPHIEDKYSPANGGLAELLIAQMRQKKIKYLKLERDFNTKRLNRKMKTKCGKEINRLKYRVKTEEYVQMRKSVVGKGSHGTGDEEETYLTCSEPESVSSFDDDFVMPFEGAAEDEPQFSSVDEDMSASTDTVLTESPLKALCSVKKLENGSNSSTVECTFHSTSEPTSTNILVESMQVIKVPWANHIQSGHDPAKAVACWLLEDAILSFENIKQSGAVPCGPTEEADPESVTLDLVYEDSSTITQDLVSCNDHPTELPTDDEGPGKPVGLVPTQKDAPKAELPNLYKSQEPLMLEPLELDSIAPSKSPTKEHEVESIPFLDSSSVEDFNLAGQSEKSVKKEPMKFNTGKMLFNNIDEGLEQFGPQQKQGVGSSHPGSVQSSSRSLRKDLLSMRSKSLVKRKHARNVYSLGSSCRGAHSQPKPKPPPTFRENRAASPLPVIRDCTFRSPVLHSYTPDFDSSSASNDSFFLKNTFRRLFPCPLVAPVIIAASCLFFFRMFKDY